MTVTTGGEPRALVQRALEDLGGIRRFVSRQDVVVLKPNIAWDRTPEQAANTNPEVVAEMVRQCWQAGAKRVIVTDVSCNEPQRCFHRSGIQAAARAVGAEVITGGWLLTVTVTVAVFWQPLASVPVTV